MTGRRSARSAAALGVLALVVVGCSDSGSDEDGPALPATATTLVPSSTGDRCDDPTDDLDAPGVPDDVRASLSGIDLVGASAVVEGDELLVRFDVAGPLAEVADPTFVVAQGDPLESLSFELRLTRTDGDWSSTLVTWPSGREQRQEAGLEIEAEDTAIATSLPLSALPPIALSLQFGAAAELPDGTIVIDDCSSLGGS
ncbi:hypothetical protein [Rhabdothermincola salaria]|uniref:hypothetical protein n=1 Tax=Rhabdothermincola salaria TaxID=2903142 RepID=UPI001E318104|nr:hypothetical protein [Rhabdothermincola salaria]MCD9624693.1 hypothetical protein [Rhabdothermincola salaria]